MWLIASRELGGKYMRQQRFKTSGPASTILSLPLLVVLIAIPFFAPAAESDDISIYPAKGQSQAQQDRDRYECHSCAVGQTGFDPSKAIAQAAIATPLPSTGYQPSRSGYQPSQRHIARGAGRGAALGAVGGAITGDAGKGAAAGAAMGGLAGGFRRRDERRQNGSLQR